MEWNLKDIYTREEDFLKDKDNLEKQMKKIILFKGKLKSEKEIQECYETMCEGLEIQEKLSGYAMLQYHLDMANSENIKRYKDIEMLTTKFNEATSFIESEISSINEKELIGIIEKTPNFRKTLTDIKKSKKHILTQAEEKLLAKYGEVFGSFENIYEILTNTEFEFPEVDGNKVTHATFSRLLTSKDSEIRRKAFLSMYSIYKKHINSIAETYLAKVKHNTITAKIKNYSASLEMETNNDDSTVSVYNTLIKAVNNNTKLNHEYLELKKKLLNTTDMHMYDVYVDSLAKVEDDISYNDCQEIIKKALKPLGEKYLETIEYAFKNNWIDVLAKPKKMNGAYSLGLHKVHPYILTNYTNTTRDVSTVAHELGHTMHSYLANNAQNIINANYTIMVAEVASTVNEILLSNYLIDNEEDKTKKASLINSELDTIRATLFRQAMFAEFEKEVHGKVEENVALSSQDLNDIYFKLVSKYFGESTIIDKEIQYEWARIPHFYRCFYVYKYATGITSAIVIAKNILEKGKPYVEKYLHMLSLGGSIGSLELLRMVDVDLEKEETFNEAFKYFENKIKTLKSLI